MMGYFLFGSSFVGWNKNEPENAHARWTEVQVPPAHRRTGLGTALLRAGDAAVAEKALRDSVRLRPESAATRYNLAVVLEFRKNLPEAESNLTRALRIDPAYGAAHLKLGEILIEQRRNADAVPHLRQAAASKDGNIAQLAAADLARIAP